MSFMCAMPMRSPFSLGGSLSGHRTTSLPAKSDQSVIAAFLVPAPPEDVVAENPKDASASTHFSPSTTITRFAPTIRSRR